MEFVTFEISKKLKEKGFRKDCIAKVNFDNTITFNHVFDNDIRTVLKCHNKLNPYIDAPTISQVLKWLREEKEIDLVIEPLFYENRRREYSVRVFAPRLNKPVHCGYFNKWKKAALAGINYYLDNLD